MTDKASDDVEAKGTGEASSGAARQRSKRLVSCLFRDPGNAERAYRALQERGYGVSEVGLVMSEETGKAHYSYDPGTKVLDGAGIGAIVGVGVGIALGTLAALGTTLILPGVGVLVAGPIAAALAGAGAGAVTGGVVGALMTYGIPETRARDYERGIREGGIVIIVSPRSDEEADYLEQEWRNCQGEAISR